MFTKMTSHRNRTCRQYYSMNNRLIWRMLGWRRDGSSKCNKKSEYKFTTNLVVLFSNLHPVYFVLDQHNPPRHFQPIWWYGVQNAVCPWGKSLFPPGFFGAVPVRFLTVDGARTADLEANRPWKLTDNLTVQSR